MRCDDIRDRIDVLWDGEQPSEVREHLAECAPCSAYQRDLCLVRAGFRLWKWDKGPVPSVGFAERLVRQLGEMSNAPGVADFFERVGRRFVYATLALTLLALLALAVPATGPLQALTAADIQVSAQEASLAYSDPIGEAGLPESLNPAPVEAPTPATGSEAK
jgi:hypothetical protein